MGADKGHHGSVNYKWEETEVGRIDSGYGNYTFNWPYVTDQGPETFGHFYVNHLNDNPRWSTAGPHEAFFWAKYIPEGTSSVTYDQTDLPVYSPPSNQWDSLKDLVGLTIAFHGTRALYIAMTSGYYVGDPPPTMPDHTIYYLSAVHPGRPKPYADGRHYVDNAFTLSHSVAGLCWYMTSTYTYETGTWVDATGVIHPYSGFFVAVPTAP